MSLAALVGCAASSPAERTAFDKLGALESSLYDSNAKTGEGGALPKLTEESEVGDFLAYAALSNPELEAAFNRWKAALYRVPQVRALPDPRFNYAYFIRSVETRTGPQQQKFGLAQTFPWFGKLSLRGDVALEAANAEQRRYESAKLALFYRVKTAYFELAYLGQAIAITKENIALVTYLEEVARTQYKAGLARARHSDIIRAQVELGKLEDRLRTLKDLEGPLRAKLNAAMNRPPDAPLPWPKPIRSDPVAFTDGELYASLRKHNPELLALDALTARDKAAVDLAEKEYFPDFTLGVEYIVTGDARQSGVPDSGEDPLVAGISVNLPIWFNKLSAVVHEKEARHRASERARVNRENVLLSDLKMAIYGFRDAERKIDLYRDTLIPKAEQSLGAMQESYSAEKADFLDLIDAERILLEFKLARDRALADRETRRAEIEMLIGKELAAGAEASTAPEPKKQGESTTGTTTPEKTTG